MTLLVSYKMKQKAGDAGRSEQTVAGRLADPGETNEPSSKFKDNFKPI